MGNIQIRKMTPTDRLDVAELICFSTNHWYQTHGRSAIFTGGPKVTEAFFDVYEALDPGCGVVAVTTDGRLVGSCFYHPRETHVSLGIMNSHPSYAGAGVARSLLGWIVDFARREGKPLRLAPWSAGIQRLAGSGLALDRPQARIFEAQRNLIRNPSPDTLLREIGLTLA